MTRRLSSASFPPRSGLDVGESHSRWLCFRRCLAKNKSDPNMEISWGRFPTGKWKYLVTQQYVNNCGPLNIRTNAQTIISHTWPCQRLVTDNCPDWDSVESCVVLHAFASQGHYSWSHQSHAPEQLETPPTRTALHPSALTPSLTVLQWAWALDVPPNRGHHFSYYNRKAMKYLAFRRIHCFTL